MKRAEGRGARGGRLHEHLDLEGRQARQVEAGLRRHLQQLELACRSRLRLLTWEQRQLRRQQERLRPGKHGAADAVKKTHPSCFGNGVQQRPGDAAACPAQGGACGAPRTAGLRAPAADIARETRKTTSRAPPARHTHLQDPEESEAQSRAQSSRGSTRAGGGPAGPAGSTDPALPGHRASPAAHWGAAPGDQAGPEDTTPPPDPSAGEQVTPRARGAGNPDSRAPASSLPQLFAQAAKAHYLRHREPPEAERLLSTAEIFGRGDPAARPRAASQSPAP